VPCFLGRIAPRVCSGAVKHALPATLGGRSAAFSRSDCDPGRGGCPGDLQEAPRPGPGIAEGNFISKSYQKPLKNYQMKARAVPPPLQRVQKAQKHEGLDRATAKTTTLSRIPAWTPPDAERQCYFFFRGARFACGRAIFCGKRRCLRGILGKQATWPCKVPRFIGPIATRVCSGAVKHVLPATLGGRSAAFSRSDCDPGRGGCPGGLQEAPGVAGGRPEAAGGPDFDPGGKIRGF